jgi:hypothetical protein
LRVQCPPKGSVDLNPFPQHFFIRNGCREELAM